MDQIQQRLSDPATADLLSAFTQTMKPEDLAGLLKSGGMDVTPKQVRALCLPAEACGLSCAGASPANHAMYDLLSLVVATSLMLSLLLQTMLLLHGKGFRKLCIQVWDWSFGYCELAFWCVDELWSNQLHPVIAIDRQ